MVLGRDFLGRGAAKVKGPEAGMGLAINPDCD